MLLLALFFVLVKLTATVLQVALVRESHRELPQTVLFRAAYVAGKVTPSLATACVSVAAFLKREWVLGGILGLLAVGISFFALHVVRLRRQGKFFGLLDATPKRNG